MMKVWIHINGVQEGPYELENLPVERMDASTPVWYDGLPDWLPAGKAPATASLFSPDPQPQVITAYATAEPAKGAAPQGKCPPTFFVWSILLTVLCCNPVGIVPIATGAFTKNKYRNHDYAGARRMSNATEWWVIITIVTSLVMAPLAFLANL